MCSSERPSLTPRDYLTGVLEEIQEQHTAFVELFNTTPHWAHREQDVALRTPVEVLGWGRGRT